MSSQVVEARRCYLGTPRPGWEPPFVVSGGWERCAEDYRIERENFPYYTLEFVAQGRGQLEMGGRRFPLSRGSFFTYGPGMPHVITTDPVEKLSKYFVNFAGRGARAAMRSAGLRPGLCQSVAAADEVQAAYEQLLFAGLRGTETAGRIAALQGRIVLLLVSEVRLSESVRTNQALSTFLRCRQFAEERFLALASAEEMAESCHVTPEYLSRLFVRFAGQPPYRWLMRLKMHHAAGLLTDRRLLVGEVADMLGMDVFQFSRSFKRVHGLSPMAFLRARPLEEREA